MDCCQPAWPRPARHNACLQALVAARLACASQAHRVSTSPYPHPAQLAQLWLGGGGRLAGSRVLWALRRLGLGFGCVALLKEGSKPALLALLPLLYRFFPLPIRRLWQPPVHNLSAAPAAPTAAPGCKQQQRNGQRHASGDSVDEEAPSGQQNAARPGVRTRRSAAAAAAASWSSEQAANAAEHASAEPAALPPQDPRLAGLPHDRHGRPWDVVATARFFSYAAIGVAVAGVAPRLLAALEW